MVLGMHEFLLRVSKLKKTEQKIEALKANDTLALRIILQAVFDPKVEFLLPPGDPPYKPNDMPDQEHVLHKEAEKLRYYVNGFYPDLNQNKREAMFIELLERVAPDDAILLCAIKDKKLPFKGITVEHVIKGLPGLIA